MKIKCLFKNTPPEFFRDDRRLAFSNLLDGLRTYLDCYEGDVQYESLNQLCLENIGIWIRFQNWFNGCSGDYAEPDAKTGFISSTLSPFDDDTFNIDGDVALINDGHAIFDLLERIGQNGKKYLSNTLRDYGLHGLHFLCGVANHEDRVKSVKLICMLLHIEPEMWDSTGVHSEIQRQSVTRFTFEDRDIEDLRLDVENYDGIVDWNNNATSSLNELTSSLVNHWIAKRNKSSQSLTVSEQAKLANELLIPFVYNYGYTLKSSGAEDCKVIDLLKPIALSCLGSVGFTGDFANSLTRQIIINTLSAFSNASTFLATNDEFQGVVSGVLLEDDRSDFFKRHVGGPLIAFIEEGSPRTALLIDQHLVEIGVSTSYDQARRGCLNKHQAISYLMNKQKGYSKALERDLENCSVAHDEIQRIRGSLKFDSYSAKALVNWAYLHINGIISRNEKKDPDLDSARGRIMDRQLRNHIAMLFKERPDVKAEAERVFLQSQNVTHRAFTLLGFGYAEIVRMGSKAPASIRKNVLMDGLNL